MAHVRAQRKNVFTQPKRSSRTAEDGRGGRRTENCPRKAVSSRYAVLQRWRPDPVVAENALAFSSPPPQLLLGVGGTWLDPTRTARISPARPRRETTVLTMMMADGERTCHHHRKHRLHDHMRIGRRICPLADVSRSYLAVEREAPRRDTVCG